MVIKQKQFNLLGKMLLSLLVIWPFSILSGCVVAHYHGHPETPGQYLDNSLITANVKSKLLHDPYVSGLNISVTSYKNQVLLQGYVKNRFEKRRAVALAHSVPGVGKSNKRVNHTQIIGVFILIIF